MGECLLLRRGGEVKKLPVLNAAHPQDATVWAGDSVTFRVEIVTPGVPADYTYQWYQDGKALSGKNNPTYICTELPTAGTRTVYCVVTNKAGSVTSRVATLVVKDPNVTYTYADGIHEKVDDGNGNWRIKLKSSANLIFTNLGKWDGMIDVFCVGGGGGGGKMYNTAKPLDGAGGGGGYTVTGKGIAVAAGTSYAIAIGAGGAGGAGEGYLNANIGAEGGTTTAFELSAAGGKGGKEDNGGAGGSGGGGASKWRRDQDDRVNKMGYGGDGGSDGGDGSSGRDGYGGVNGAPGKGQGTTTREFGEADGDLYAGGGGGIGFLGCGAGGSGGGGSATWSAAEAGTDNTGGGGSGGRGLGGDGGSGIAVIRNTRSTGSIMITRQPQHVTVAAETGVAVFTVEAAGTELSYQWQFLPTGSGAQWSNTSADGAATPQLSIQGHSYRNGYQYRCVMTDASGNKAISEPVFLTVQS
jgi:hypothetical protein